MKQEHKNKIDDAELVAAFNDTPHLGKLKAKFGLPEITIWRRLKKLGLKCSSKSPDFIPTEEILAGLHPHYQTFKLNRRLVKEQILKYECACCGLTDWNGKKIALQLDHINGNNSDHRRDNLRLVCPNCHSQTETYCGKNK